MLREIVAAVGIGRLDGHAPSARLNVIASEFARQPNHVPAFHSLFSGDLGQKSSLDFQIMTSHHPMLRSSNNDFADC